MQKLRWPGAFEGKSWKDVEAWNQLQESCLIFNACWTCNSVAAFDVGESIIWIVDAACFERSYRLGG